MPELNEKYVDKLKDELEYINDDLKSLSEDSPDILPKVLEDDFVEYLLPYMLNLVDKKENDKTFFNNWMRLVGDVTVGFYVVNRNGDILFKVPKYLGRLDDINTPISDVSYITILKEFEKEYERIPVKAENDLSKAIDTLSSMVAIDRESLQEVFSFYVFIRKRYEDYYNEYKSKIETLQLNQIEERIEELQQQLYNSDPEDYVTKDKIEKELKALIKKRNELSPSDNKEVDYSEVDYED